MQRCAFIRGDADALLKVMTMGDARKRITWDDAVLQLAAAYGWVLVANCSVTPRRFAERAQ
jgi:hypothetical protein